MDRASARLPSTPPQLRRREDSARVKAGDGPVRAEHHRNARVVQVAATPTVTGPFGSQADRPVVRTIRFGVFRAVCRLHAGGDRQSCELLHDRIGNCFDVLDPMPYVARRCRRCIDRLQHALHRPVPDRVRSRRDAVGMQKGHCLGVCFRVGRRELCDRRDPPRRQRPLPRRFECAHLGDERVTGSATPVTFPCIR